ncbi:hypothetical protein BCD67_10445 [Oscillatoriales cyanobacterium USR001]|nr:hypothetical protein BCD67_10445 [Oscillatoriales cyanobacterium USR001]
MSSFNFQNYRNQNLQGRSFKGQDLTNTDFSYANIQGADFTGANLTGANFSHVKAGFSRRWLIGMVIVVAILGIIAGAGAATGPIESVHHFNRVPGFNTILPEQQFYPKKSIGLIPALLVFLLIFSANASFLIISLRQGIQKALGSLLIAFVATILLIGILALMCTQHNEILKPLYQHLLQFRTGSFIDALKGDTKNEIPSLIVYLFVTLISTITASVALPLAVTLAEVVGSYILRNLVIFETMAIATIATGITSYNSAKEGLPQPLLPPDYIIIATAIILAVILVLISAHIGKKTFAEDQKYDVLRQIAIFILCFGGPSFRGADLTNTNFSYATLKSADFSFAKIDRTLWYNSRQLNWAKLEETILNNPAVRDLLVTRNGHRKSYQEAILRGANLMDADLTYANLKNADLTNATLEAANLQWANLTQVQAIGADFNNAQMTGACGLGTWNIDNTTKLDWVDCEFVYLLEEPKPGTDDRERRPSSGEFQVGEFTGLFQEVVDTVDLIFRDGLDWKAFTKSYQKVQVENEGTELEIQGIENKGDGVVVVKVKVSSDANKGKIHGEFLQFYQEMLALAEKERQSLEAQMKSLALRQQQELEEQKQYLYSIVEKMVAKPVIQDKLVVLNLDYGNFEQGFTVAAEILSDGHHLPRKFKGELPPNTEICQIYRQWQGHYNAQGSINRIKAKKGQITQFSKQDLTSLANDVENGLKTWLKSDQFRPIEDKLRQYLNSSDEVRVIIQSENDLLRRLPWHLWHFFTDYHKSEFGLSAPTNDRANKIFIQREQVRILSILGNSKNINIEEDRQILQNLPNTEIEFLVEPSRQKLQELLWDENGWDMICFSGHSQSQADGSTGIIHINKTEELSLEQLKNGLKNAIERGLQLAIFNSCDGLGLARDLADLHIPQIIAMREPVPDIIAQDFLKHFLKAFANGKSLYVSVREARAKLQDREDKFPCASWLPAIFQNQSEAPKTWQEFRAISP